MPIPMLTCTSVAASRAWYERVLGLVSVHGGDEYDQLATIGPDGPTTVLQLHHMSDTHAHLADPAAALGGNGVAVWFESTHYPTALATLRAAVADGATVAVLEDDHLNPTAHHREFWLADPDGYTIVVSSPYGDVDL
ncbi:MAG TPA: VOC family protein [Ilumatobacter sp.]|nr:VOC family protein [Ilumatobacter sp.]